MRVFVHVKDRSGAELRNIELEFDQVPAVGEYFVLDTDDVYYQAEIVVHVPTRIANCVAEVYGVPVKFNKLIAKYTEIRYPVPPQTW